MVYLEYYNTRFWFCEQTAARTVKITYGKCGSNGRTIWKTNFESDTDVIEYVANSTKSKIILGYIHKTVPDLMASALKTSTQGDNQLNMTVAKNDGMSSPKKRSSSDLSSSSKNRFFESEMEYIKGHLASKMDVINNFYARLAHVDPSKNVDYYCILQILANSKNKKQKISSFDEISKAYHVYIRSGSTGSEGNITFYGPFDMDAAEKKFCTIFKSKTGYDWGKEKPDGVNIMNKYEFIQPTKSSSESNWYYYLTFDPLGKPDGWYKYDDRNAAQTEALYGDYESSHRANRFSVRLVHSTSSGFTYKVNLSNMTQTNTQTGTIRPIQRTTTGQAPTDIPPDSNPVPKSRPRTAKKTTKFSSSNAGDDIDMFVSSKLKSGTVYGEYNIMLNQTNLDANNNKYYKIQLIDNGSGIYLFTRWGRVGENGSFQEVGPMDPTKAIKQFQNKFKSKTANKWENRHDFDPQPRKYTIIEMENSSSKANASSVPTSCPSATLPCKLQSQTKNLVDLIFDEDMFKTAMSDMNLDPAKLPLGALSKAQITKGFEALERLEHEINDGAGQDTIMRLTSDFYTTIPHAFGRRRGPILNTQALIDEKYEMLNTLGDIEIAQSIQKGTDDGKKTLSSASTTTVHKTHPSDLNYSSLSTDLDLIQPHENDYQIIKRYLLHTSGQYKNMTLRHVWRANRHDESKRYSLHSSLSNRKLLWHGTSIAVVAAILKSGLRIMPHSGGRVGRGIYLADCHEKSAGYVRPVAVGGRCGGGDNNGQVGIMFLVEAALGRQCEIVRDDPTLVRAPDGFDSVLAKGTVAPDESCDVTMDIDGHQVAVPQGAKADIALGKGGSSFHHNEFLVYKESQHRIRYVLTFDM